MNHRPILPLMLLMTVFIALFFLLNLLLGSVDIPLRSVCRILAGGTDEPAGSDGAGSGRGPVGQRPADADGVPQSAGRPFGAGR